MQRTIGLLVLGVLFLGSLWVALRGQEQAVQKQEPQPTAKAGDDAEVVDFLPTARYWNSEKYPDPPSKFRQGHVKPRKLDAKAIKKTENGFSIQLPSGAPIPTPSIYKDKVYVSGGFSSKEFYCFDASTGALVWGIDLDDDGPSSAACEDDVIIFNTESCTIFAVDARTGKLLWSHWLGDPLTSTPTIANGRVFTSYPSAGRAVQNAPNPPPNGAQQVEQAPPQAAAPKKPVKVPEGVSKNPPTHVLACLDLKTGKILWQRWIDSDVMSAPVAMDQELYAASFGGTIYKFQQSDGKILSAKRSRATSAPVVVGKDVFFTKRVDKAEEKQAAEALVKADRGTQTVQLKGERKKADYLDEKVQLQTQLAQQGKQLDAGNGFGGGNAGFGGSAPNAANPQAALGNVGQASVATMQAYQGSRVLNAGGRNFNCPGNEVLCTDTETGKKLWSIKLEGDLKKVGGFLAAPPVSAGGQLFVGTLKGEVLQIDPDQGKVNQTYKVGGPVRFQPVLHNGRLYVGTQDGKLVCIDTGNQKFTGWPMWGGNAARTSHGRVAKK